MKLIITGATGFIGTNLVKYLLFEKKIKELLLIDNFKSSSKSNLQTLKKIDKNKKIIFIKHSISSKKVLSNKNFNKNYDCIIHLAAQSSGENSFYEPIYDIDTNIIGIVNVVDIANKVSAKNIIYTSTMSVYGDVKHNQKIKENQNTNPKSIYGITKLASENLLKTLCNERKIKYTIFRLFNVYGGFQNLQNLKQGMLSIYLYYLLNKKNIIVKGSLDRYRDFIFIDDLIDVFKLTLLKNSKNKTYNIGTGRKTTVKKLIYLLINNLNLDQKKIKIIIKKNTPGDIKGIVANINKFQKDYKWKPLVKIEKGISKTINFYKVNETK